MAIEIMSTTYHSSFDTAGNDLQKSIVVTHITCPISGFISSMLYTLDWRTGVSMMADVFTDMAGNDHLIKHCTDSFYPTKGNTHEYC